MSKISQIKCTVWYNKRPAWSGLEEYSANKRGKCDWKVQKKTRFKTKSLILVGGCNENMLCETAATLGRNRNHTEEG